MDQFDTLSGPEIQELLTSWLSATPDLSFAQARKDASKVGIAVSPRQFAAAKKALGLPAGPPRVVTRKGASEMGDDTPRGRTPLMAFVIEYLQGHPEASFREVREAGEAGGFKVAPVVFGKGRSLLGLAPMAGRGRRSDGADFAEENLPGIDGGAAPVGRGRRGRRRGRGVDLDSLGSLVTDLQGVVTERDRAYKALSEIQRVIERFFATH